MLIDVVMPQIDGFQLAAMIREHPRFQKLAMIFVSGVQIAETDHLRGYEIGAVDYVTVPVVPEVLRAKVRVFIELYRKTRQLEAMNSELEKRVAARTAELEAQTEKLRQSEERRSIALSAGDMGSWEVDLTTGHIEWDEGPYRIFDVDPQTFQPTVERIEAMMHPEDRDRSSVTAIVAAGEPRFQVEFRIVRPSGEVRWCYGAGIISHDAEGRPVRMNGVTVDVTDRKRAEERQLLLAREVDHRAKNMLAVVLSVLRLTKAKTTADFISTVEGPHPCAGGDAQSSVVDALAGCQPAPDRRRGDGALPRRPPRARDRRRPRRDAAAGHRAGRRAGPSRACDQRRQVRRAVDRHRQAEAHLVDRSRRPRARMAGDRRTAGRGAVRRWASASPSCVPASRRSSAAASSTTGGRRVCAAGCSSRARRSSIRSRCRRRAAPAAKAAAMAARAAWRASAC